MGGRQIAAVVVLLALGVAGVAVPAVGLSADTATQPANATEGVGTQLTSFAQSTAVDARSSIDSGMWDARIDNQSADPAAELRDRAEQLQRRLARLENRTLPENRTDSPGYTARAAAVRAEISNVRSAIEAANESADRHGVDAGPLRQLRSRAGNLTGPEIGALARNMTDPPRGPPDDRGGDRGPPDGDDSGPPDDSGPADGDGSSDGDSGPPDDRGPPADRGGSPGGQ